MDSPLDTEDAMEGITAGNDLVCQQTSSLDTLLPPIVALHKKTLEGVESACTAVSEFDGVTKSFLDVSASRRTLRDHGPRAGSKALAFEGQC